MGVQKYCPFDVKNTYESNVCTQKGIVITQFLFTMRFTSTLSSQSFCVYFKAPNSTKDFPTILNIFDKNARKTLKT